MEKASPLGSLRPSVSLSKIMLSGWPRFRAVFGRYQFVRGVGGRESQLTELFDPSVRKLN